MSFLRGYFRKINLLHLRVKLLKGFYGRGVQLNAPTRLIINITPPQSLFSHLLIRKARLHQVDFGG